jgi:acetyl esterase/lipase
MKMHWRTSARKIVVAFSLLLSSVLLDAQGSPIVDEIPRDTSFTLYSAWKGIVKEHPFSKPVLAELPQGVIAAENLIYGSLGNRLLHIDLFRPANNSHAPYPGVLLIHGGGWRSGNRQMEFPMAQRLAEKGYVTATVEYRLSPEALYPAAVHDIKAAIRWMRAHASEYNIDSTRIAVYGCSAGGQLAALVGVTAGLPRFDGGEGDTAYSTAVQAIVDIDGIVDLTHPAESGKDTGSAPPSAGKRWFGVSFKERPDLWKEASPLNYVSSTTPPILFVNSSLERFHAGRDGMIEKMTALNIYSEVHSIPSTPHPFWLFHPWFAETFKYVGGFLDKTLKQRR